MDYNHTILLLFPETRQQNDALVKTQKKKKKKVIAKHTGCEWQMKMQHYNDTGKFP